jgi:hypothetical protein
LDEEVDNQHNGDQLQMSKSRPLLPTVLSFLQASIPTELYLDILVQCTRKTELRSWRTLFTYLPPPKELFEHALKLNSLKTAAGYLLVLQSFDDKEDDGNDERIEDSVVRLLKLASQKGDWELCGELARFLIALDASGEMLRRAVATAGLRKRGQPSPTGPNGTGPVAQKLRGLALTLPTSSPLSSLSPSAAGYRWPGVSYASSAASAASASTAPASPAIGDKDTDDGSRHEEGSSGGEDFTSLSPSSR